MRGKMVERRFGWDCHGLPAELHSEKRAEALRPARHPQIRHGALQRALPHLGHAVPQATGNITSTARRAGSTSTTTTAPWTSPTWRASCGRSNSSGTRGWSTRASASCPIPGRRRRRCRNFETRLDNSYRMRQDPALTVAFKLHPKHGETIAPKLLAWTTTPWTLPSNLALAVQPEADYALMEKGGERWILADASREHYATELDGFAKVGSAQGRRADRPQLRAALPVLRRQDGEGAFRVARRRLHRARRGHRRRPYRAGLRRGRHGGRPGGRAAGGRSRSTSRATSPTRCRPMQGKNVFEANKDIIRDLKAAGVVVRHETYEHNYPHCWRTDQPLIYKAIPSWYVKVTAFTRPHGRAQPGHHLGAGARQGRHLRQLARATPATGTSAATASGARRSRCGSRTIRNIRASTCYGSLDEIERDFGVRPKDLHRPYVDELTRPNPDDPTGKSMMRRVEDVLDCWFESGSMPFAQVHYPFENKEWFDEPFPRRLHRRICRADARLVLHADGDGDGALRQGAVPELHLPRRRARREQAEALQAAEELSRTRSPSSTPTAPMRCAGTWSRRRCSSGGDLAMPKDGRAIGDAVRSVLLPIWNAYSFFTLYANIDGIKGKLVTTAEAELDRYILGKTAELVRARRGGDGPARPRRGLQRAAAVHRGAQQLVHPPLARPLLEERRRTPTSAPPTTRSTPCWSR